MIKIFTHNDKDIHVEGTSLIGYIKIDYDILFMMFGVPTAGDEYKSDAEWEIELKDGKKKSQVFTIYNWKDGVNYNGEDGFPVEIITDWHIGGNSPLNLLNDYMIQYVLEHGEVFLECALDKPVFIISDKSKLF